MARQKTLTAPTNFSTLPPGTKARIGDDYALYAGQTCAIAARPSHDAAIVELESGARERIPVKYLEELEPECFKESLDEVEAELLGDRPCHGGTARKQSQSLSDNAGEGESTRGDIKTGSVFLRQMRQHNFSPVWGNGELIEFCRCGETRSPSIESVEQFLNICHTARESYASEAEKFGGKKKQELLESAQKREEQIAWLNQRLEELKSKPIAAEVVGDELTIDEERDRHHLERKVDAAMYEGWSALRELRERQLYRNTHKNWEEYCKDRFGFGRDSADLKVLAAQVVDNLKELPTNGRQILPTSERQIRPITKAQLSASEQRQVWQEAVKEADGKVPTGRIVKGIVERLREKPLNLASSYCAPLEIFKLQRLSGKESKYNGCWSIALEVENRFTVKCRVYDTILDIRQENIKRVDMTEEELVIQRQVIERVSRLARCDLDPAAWALLEVLNRQVHYTDFQMKLLETAEQFYGVKTHEN